MTRIFLGIDGGGLWSLSRGLARNRDEYYARLAAVTRENDWTGWSAFFLRAIAEQAKTNIARVQAILSLYETMKTRVREITRSQHSAQIVDALFDRPIFRIGDFATRAGIPKPTAHPLLRQLQDAGLLKGKEKLLEGKDRELLIIKRVIGSNEKFADLLRAEGTRLHSRKLRAFDEPPFR